MSSRTPDAASSVLASGQAEGQADRDDRDARPDQRLRGRAAEQRPVAAAATGATPVSRPARLAPSRRTLEYHKTKATAVTVTAR